MLMRIVVVVQKTIIRTGKTIDYMYGLIMVRRKGLPGFIASVYWATDLSQRNALFSHNIHCDSITVSSVIE